MISYEMKTKMIHITGYFKTGELRDKALSDEYPSSGIVRMSHFLYDHNLNKFTKNRDTGDCKLLNSMLFVAQNRDVITDDMWELVNGHL